MVTLNAQQRAPGVSPQVGNPTLIFFGQLLLLIILWLSWPGPSAHAQDALLQGFVTDATSGEALAGANVVVYGSGQKRQGAVTNEEGYFLVDELSPGRYRVRVSFVGYVSHLDTLYLRDPRRYSVQLSPRQQALDEVVVTSRKGAAALNAGRQEIEPSDLRRIPTPGPGGGDLAGYLKTLPGVVSMGDRGGQLFIRGGKPSQNLILMDGIRIYRPFHAVGFFSAFPEDLVSEVELYEGGFGARYSGRISSVMDVSMRGGNNRQFEGRLALSPFLTSLRAEGPVQRGSLSFLGSVRRSTIEQTAPALIGQEVPMKFSDAFFKLQHAGQNFRCSGSTMHTYDRGRVDATRDRSVRWGNLVVGGRCAGFTPGSGSFSEVNVGLTHAFNEIGTKARTRSAHTWGLGVDMHLTHSLGETALIPGDDTKIQWGVYGRRDVWTYHLKEKFQHLRDGSSIVLNVGGHLGMEMSPIDNLDLKPSVALTQPFDYGVSVEPRFRMAWRPWGTEARQLNAALGLYRQTIAGISDERDAGASFTAWVPAPINERRVQALHALTGWRQDMGRLGLSVEGYYKRLTDLPVPRWSPRPRFTTEMRLADGRVYGFDTRVELEQGPFYLYLGYGYMWMQYTAPDGNFGEWFSDPLQSYHPPHDRRHQLKGIGSLDVGRFTTQIRWQYGSGLPFTQPIGFDTLIHWSGLNEHPASDAGTGRVLFQKPYRGRLPTYHRLDLSVEYVIPLSLGQLTLRAGGINAYNRQNLFYYDVFTLQRVDQLPLMPFVSIELETSR
ncbi:hypothetical protein BSZ35_06785 [Salinibacter sp. 10B]|uniref:TonB-dependent receptor n=1 Tax=Salinibacter sp. 10B TaxID=1923971 RepID=UPI000CF4E8D9|nr:TonB-dependent receptor [Salinibacter sp. 10B]PQJ34345.1 hypothetical protein BSZ35_06785 [Salinibacter sp. 10B]